MYMQDHGSTPARPAFICHAIILSADGNAQQVASATHDESAKHMLYRHETGAPAILQVNRERRGSMT